MKVIFKNKNGELIHGDNLEVLLTIKDNLIHSCISDFPYNLSFMGKKWDTQKNFYEWCKLRAEQLYRVLRPGGFALIFGHPKTNHRMKCAFEDVGFNIVEEIDWIYFSGFPKNQDIGKMFDKKAGVERKKLGIAPTSRPNTDVDNQILKWGGHGHGKLHYITTPTSDLAKKWDGWKTAGLKPAKEPITVFQKPLEGRYVDNIEKWSCGGFNIDACRIPCNIELDKVQDRKINRNINLSNKEKGWGMNVNSKQENVQVVDLQKGRFPANIIFDEYAGQLLNEQIDGGSRFFYCPKVSPSEKKLPDGTRNEHITLKPKELIKWLIKLTTPKNGITIDITAGTGTHAVACEELNRDEGYDLKWINIELLNTEEEPNCNTAKMRIEAVCK